MEKKKKIITKSERRSKHWNEGELNYLTDNYKIKTLTEMTLVLKRTENSIRWMASQLELTDKPNYWRKEELIFISQNYTVKTIDEMANHLKRSKLSVSHKISELKISKTLQYEIDVSNIETKVPYYNGKAGEYRMLLQAMKQGDSFEYPSEERQTIQNQIKYFSDRVYRTREIDSNTRRVWRLL